MNRIWHGRKNHGRKFELIWNTIHVYTSGQFLCYQMTSKKLGFQKLEDLLNSGKQKKVSWIFCPKNTSFISYSKVLNTPTRDLLCNSGFTRSFLLCVFGCMCVCVCVCVCGFLVYFLKHLELLPLESILKRFSQFISICLWLIAYD